MVVDQEDSVSLIVDQGKSCSLVVDQEDSGTAISGAPGSKLSKAPLVEVPKAQVKRHICTSFLGGPEHAHSFSEIPFPGVWGEILQNSDGQKTTL